jgi:hypothetical protein
MPTHQHTPGIIFQRCTVLATLACLASHATAQEAMYTEAATMPSPGVFTLRPQFHASQYGTNPLNTNEREKLEVEAMTSLQYGLARGLSLTLNAHAKFERDEDPTGEREWNVGVDDLHAMFKYRVYMDNPGGVDTTRVALLGGATVASGDNQEFSSQSVNPMLGGVLTIVRGRHGFNQDIIYKVNTGGNALFNNGGDGPDDALMLGSAWVYRIVPAAFTSETEGAWYTTLELNTLYETSGDTDVRWSPGIMYEGRMWAFEAMLQFPLWHDLDERAELDWSAGFGFRFTF